MMPRGERVYFYMRAWLGFSNYQLVISGIHLQGTNIVGILLENSILNVHKSNLHGKSPKSG